MELDVLNSYNNSPMELDVLKSLKERFDKPEKQREEVTRLINEFGNKNLTQSAKVGTGKLHDKEGKEIMQTISSAESDVLDIMCLAQLLFEGGDKKISLKIRRQILDIDIEGEPKYPENLTYLQKCLTNFKPAIYKNLKEHFAGKFGVSEDDVQCLP